MPGSNHSSVNFLVNAKVPLQSSLSSYWTTPSSCGFKLKKGGWRWDIGKELFPLRVEMPWHRQGAPGSLELSKARLDRWKMPLPMAGGRTLGL